MVSHSGQSLSGQSLSGQSLSGQSLSGQSLSGQSLSGQSLSGQCVLLQVLEDMRQELLTSYKAILDAVNLLFSAHQFLTTHGMADRLHSWSCY